MNMTRRTFAATTVAGAMATLLPSWLQFKQRKSIDLTPFCDDSWSPIRRYKLDAPFAQDGLVYATDGRICVRTGLADAPGLTEAAKLPGASQLPWWNRDRSIWKPWPAQRYYGDGDKGICPYCDGKGGFGNLKPCVECDGDGFEVLTADDITYIDDAQTIDCRKCNGSGSVSAVRCGYCKGTGWTERPHMLRLGETLIGGQFDCKLRALGDLEYATFADIGKDVSPVAIRGDGFEALVMPIVLNERRRIP